MRNFSRSGYLSKLGRLSIVVWAVLAIAGCSSQLSRVQTWDGDTKDASEVALLKAPSEVKVSEVNGKRVGNFLMDDLSLDYELLPGNNQVVFTYKTIWAKSGVVKNGESKVHIVETAPQQVNIDAQAGATYRIQVPKPANRRAAEAVVADFSGTVVNQSGVAVATSEPYVAASAVAANTAPVAGNAESADNALNTLDALKVFWKKASADEKREFLDWAFE